jgi:hypothetical protein
VAWDFTKFVLGIEMSRKRADLALSSVLLKLTEQQSTNKCTSQLTPEIGQNKLSAVNGSIIDSLESISTKNQPHWSEIDRENKIRVKSKNYLTKSLKNTTKSNSNKSSVAMGLFNSSVESIPTKDHQKRSKTQREISVDVKSQKVSVEKIIPEKSNDKTVNLIKCSLKNHAGFNINQLKPSSLSKDRSDIVINSAYQPSPTPETGDFRSITDTDHFREISKTFDFGLGHCSPSNSSDCTVKSHSDIVNPTLILNHLGLSESSQNGLALDNVGDVAYLNDLNLRGFSADRSIYLAINYSVLQSSSIFDQLPGIMQHQSRDEQLSQIYQSLLSSRERLLTYWRRSDESRFYQTTPNGLCGYICMDQCIRRQKLGNGSDRDDITSVDLSNDMARVQFLQQMTDRSSAAIDVTDSVISSSDELELWTQYQVLIGLAIQ